MLFARQTQEWRHRKEPMPRHNQYRDTTPSNVDHLHHHFPVALYYQHTARESRKTITRHANQHLHSLALSGREQVENCDAETDHTAEAIHASKNSSRQNEITPKVLGGSKSYSGLIFKALNIYPQSPTDTQSPPRT